MLGFFFVFYMSLCMCVQYWRNRNTPSKVFLKLSLSLSLVSTQMKKRSDWSREERKGEKFWENSLSLSLSFVVICGCGWYSRRRRVFVLSRKKNRYVASSTRSLPKIFGSQGRRNIPKVWNFFFLGVERTYERTCIQTGRCRDMDIDGGRCKEDFFFSLSPSSLCAYLPIYTL